MFVWPFLNDSSQERLSKYRGKQFGLHKGNQTFLQMIWACVENKVSDQTMQMLKLIPILAKCTYQHVPYARPRLMYSLLQVIMGGGRRYFLPNTTMDPETNTVDKNQRQDGLDLIKVFLRGYILI